MHHAVTDRNRQCSDLGPEELNDLAKSCRHVARLGGRPGLVDQDLALGALGALGDQVRIDADALDLALEPAL